MENKVSDILRQAKAKLKKHGLLCYALEAELLLAHLICNGEREKIINILDLTIDKKLTIKYFELVHRRLSHEPIAYILGKKWFWDLEFIVTKDTLTPRNDTETIIEQVLQYFPILDANLEILDMGTGSGCLAVTLAHIFINSQVKALDISADALEIAKQNSHLAQVEGRMEFIVSDWFAALPPQKFDIIVCNPPYISIKEFTALTPEVQNFEPKIALTDFDNGYYHYQTIAQKLKYYLKPNGRAFFEIGINQAMQVTQIFQQQGYDLENIVKDLNQIERCVIVS